MPRTKLSKTSTRRMVRFKVNNLFMKRRRQTLRPNSLNSMRSKLRRLITENKLSLTKPLIFSTVRQLKVKIKLLRVLLRRSERPRRLPIRPTSLLPKPRKPLLPTRIERRLPNLLRLSELLRTEPTKRSRKCNKHKSTSISSRLSSLDSKTREMRFLLVDWKKNSIKLLQNSEDSKRLMTRQRRPRKTGMLKKPDSRKLRLKLIVEMIKLLRKKLNKISKLITKRSKERLVTYNRLRVLSNKRRTNSRMLPMKERDWPMRRRDKREKPLSAILMDKRPMRKLKLKISEVNTTTGCN